MVRGDYHLPGYKSPTGAHRSTHPVHVLCSKFLVIFTKGEPNTKISFYLKISILDFSQKIRDPANLALCSCKATLS